MPTGAADRSASNLSVRGDRAVRNSNPRRAPAPGPPRSRHTPARCRSRARRAPGSGSSARPRSARSRRAPAAELQQPQQTEADVTRLTEEETYRLLGTGDRQIGDAAEMLTQTPADFEDRDVVTMDGGGGRRDRERRRGPRPALRHRRTWRLPRHRRGRSGHPARADRHAGQGGNPARPDRSATRGDAGIRL